MFIIGESGCGKDFLAEELCKPPSLYHKVILTTTRPIRENETQDENYHYVGDAEFHKMVEMGKIGGVKYFNNWGYGIQYKDLHSHKINNPNVEEIIRRYGADKSDFLEESSWGLVEELVDNSKSDEGKSALRVLRSILMKL